MPDRRGINTSLRPGPRIGEDTATRPRRPSGAAEGAEKAGLDAVVVERCVRNGALSFVDCLEGPCIGRRREPRSRVLFAGRTACPGTGAPIRLPCDIPHPGRGDDSRLTMVNIKLMTLVRSSNTPTLNGRFHDGARRARRWCSCVLRTQRPTSHASRQAVSKLSRLSQ